MGRGLVRASIRFPYFFADLRQFTSEYRHPVWYGKTRMVWLRDSEKKFEDMLYVLT